MERHRALIVDSTLTRRLVSPLAITLLDGDEQVVGQVVYQVDSDEGVPVVCDGNAMPIYGVWKGPITSQLYQRGSTSNYLCTSKLGEEPMQQCYFRGCLCNTPKTRIMRYQWVQERAELETEAEHWLQEKGIDAEMYRNPEFYAESCLRFRKVPFRVMRDPGREWKDTWIDDCTVSSPYFSSNHSVESKEEMAEQNASFFNLPLEIYEVLVKHLDGSSFISLANSSSEMERRMLEPFLSMPSAKKEHKWCKYSSLDLNRQTVIKIWSSFDTRVGRFTPAQKRADPFEFGEAIETLTWEKIFKSYKDYWALLVNSSVKVESLNNFESRLKSEAMILQKEIRTPERENVQLVRMTRTGGGRMLYNVMFPFPVDEQNPLNMVVVEDCEKSNCRHAAAICKNATSPSQVKVKVVHLFTLSPGSNEGDMPKPSHVSKVLLGVCDNCISITSLQGGPTRTIGIPPVENPEDQSFKMEPIIEIQENIVVLWLHPGYLIVFIVTPSPEVERSFDIRILYRLQAPQMRYVWDHVATYRSDYLPIIRKYKGTTTMLSEEARQFLTEDYSNPTAEPAYYGLAFISPIYGIECIKPAESTDPPSTVVESIPPQHYVQNGRKYLPAFREWTCSGKGHGLFVFCTDKALAVSWNGVSWIFGPIKLPLIVKKTNEIRNVIHVDVIYDNGLLLVVNDNILLVELTITTKPPEIFVHNGINVVEPELGLKMCRVFRLGLAPLLMEITHVELDFDRGRPFLFIVAEKKVKINLAEKLTKWEWDDLSFRVKRITF